MQFARRPTILPEWYQPHSPEHPDIYETGLTGVAELYAGMSAAGLLERTAAPRLPRWPPAGLSFERADELWPHIFDPIEREKIPLAKVLLPHERPAVADAIAKYLIRFEAATGKQPVLQGKVLAYKFSSSDGWLITPDECRTIADGLEHALVRRRVKLLRGLQKQNPSHTPETIAELLLEWTRYNRVAADHEGYRVW